MKEISMAFIHIDHLPETIKTNTPLNLIVPDPARIKGIPVRERKILYLLHGLSDDASAWQRFSAIETYAALYGLVVVMPSAGRSFYTDQPNGQNYFSYLVKELPRYLADLFGIIPTRDNTLIAGLSMGGYGAFKAAFLHPEQYFAAASFSGTLSLTHMSAAMPDYQFYEEFSLLFGDLKKLPGSQQDPVVWLQQAVADHVTLPKLYIACGKQDKLYPLNQYFNAACQKAQVDVEYRECDGDHNWIYWNDQIQWFLSRVLEPVVD
jgi:putative tributyrin esterase